MLAAASTGEAADMLEFQLAMLADDSLSGPAFDAIDAGAHGGQGMVRCARRRDRRLRSGGRRIFPRARGRPEGHPPAGARRADLRRRPDRSAGRDPVRRGHRADALPGDGLVGRRRHRAVEGQFGEPCRDAGALARRADGGRARERREGRRRPCPARRRAWRHRAQADAKATSRVSANPRPPMANAAGAPRTA